MRNLYLLIMNSKEINRTEEKRYTAPDVEVVVIEIEQNILVDSSGDGGINDFGDGGYL